MPLDADHRTGRLLGRLPRLTAYSWAELALLVLIAVQCANVADAERRLRARGVVARIEEERLVLDLRTVFVAEEDAVVAALNEL